MSIKSALAFIFKCALVGAVVLAFYGVYLDAQVTKRFAHARYQAPALIYSRALSLEPHQNISLAQVISELHALDYRESRSARDPGEFQQANQQILLHRRAFDFPDNLEPAKRVRLLFNESNVLERIESWPEQDSMTAIRLEPQLMGRFPTGQGEDRLILGLEEVPALMKETLLLVEDQDFYHHAGVRPTAIVRAVLANIAAGRTVQGGSTITQQLVKNMFLSSEQTYIRKFNEALMALILDFRFSKDEILEAYFNEVFFGQDGGHAIHGIGLGSHFYFGKTPQNLNVDEIALLIGMVKGPSLYNPRRNPENAKGRRDLVLRLMFENDLINQTQYLAAIDREVRTREQTRLSRYGRPDFIDAVQAELNDYVQGSQWHRTGLKIYTTFDPEQQARLESSARSQFIPDQVKSAERALLVTDYRTGAIEALIGGAEPVNAGFNRALNAQRAIGSLVKPWVYALAFENEAEFNLITPVQDTPIELVNERGDLWQPQNYDETFRGEITLLEAFIDSRNAPVVRVGMEIGADQVRRRLVNAGAPASIHSYPSLMLGTIEMSPFQISQLYVPLLNEGKRVPLHTIEAVTTHRGESIFLRENTATQVLTPEAARMARYAMEQVVARGTGQAISDVSEDIGGKTGSTDDLRDSWFVSFDGARMLTVWVGYDNNSPVGLTGSAGALPLAREYWRRSNIQPLDRVLPETMHWIYVDAMNMNRVGPDCSEALRIPMMGVAATEFYDCRGRLRDQEQKEERSWFERIFG
ncbi:MULTISPECIES: penicillin-binding protein 1B [Gammaproteobacteria]|uniref:penicillin-binding protein 1B n=1 Tax=Gammaproteobacteria TaxID=1236 RepID=UPI000DD083E7|nr:MULTISPECIES: penicillin-binding protein 1B [Gammaproteobacteria]RTE85639.1 penicillin-binding protein 1B [Aliidiomarina sp. B3213]TCZ89608.1 penicillin-binding protein 1B [Lysobacter sp. N42]